MLSGLKVQQFCYPLRLFFSDVLDSFHRAGVMFLSLFQQFHQMPSSS